MTPDPSAARQERALKVRHRIAARYLNGDEATAEQVFDALPYSAIPDWWDVERVLEVLSLAGLLTPTEGTDLLDRAVADIRAQIQETDRD